MSICLKQALLSTKSWGCRRIYLGEIFKDLVLQREIKILEGYLMGYHVHIMNWMQSLSNIVIFLRKITMILEQKKVSSISPADFFIPLAHFKT